MKKILGIGFCLVGVLASAQNFRDGLRYSVEEFSGTARYKAMSGAFSSLGGDLSAMALNPAGSTTFADTEITGTIAVGSTENKSTYFGTSQTAKSSDFAFSQFGIVMPIHIGREGWRNVAFGFNYQQTHNFDPQDSIYRGQTSGNNLSDYFQYYANGIEQQNLMLQEYGSNKLPSRRWRLDDLYSSYGAARRFSPFKLRNALLGYTTGLIKPMGVGTTIDPSMSDAQANAVLQQTQYEKNVNGATVQNIERFTEGGVNRYNFNFGGKYDFFSFGINLNSHSVDYREITRHRETYTNNTVSDIRSAYFQNEVRTTGNGFSLQLGAIAEIAQGVRIGLSYASPTWYSLQDEFTQSLSVATQSNGTFFADPRVTAVYDEYKFRTPDSWTVGASWVWNKSLIISGDYTYKGYSNLYFRSDFLRDENNIVGETLGDASSVRLGAEYRFVLNERMRLYLRGGYRYEQSPYKTDFKPIGDLNSFSTGVGLTLGGMRFDLSYDMANQTRHPQMYESVLTDAPETRSNFQNILLSFSFKL